MGNLMAYSGIVTKIRAMERQRLRENQFQEMAALESVPEAVAYLRKNPAYERIFEGLSQEELHRGRIEQLLHMALYQDFARIYRFANLSQRRMLDLYFRRYELSIIKGCLRAVAGGKEEGTDLSEFQEFFQQHSRMDLTRLSQCASIGQWVGCLKGSPYYGPLEELSRKGELNPTDCETVLDMTYFKEAWRIKKRYLKKEEQQIITQCFGTRMDMLNIQWIYRAKKYYGLSGAQIIAVLIPIRLHLTKNQVTRMAQAESLEGFFDILKTTYYGRMDGEERPDLKKLAAEINDRVYEMTRRSNPYSIAALNSYLYFKEKEIRRITTTLERIRYGVAAG